jgi:oligoribonuclease
MERIQRKQSPEHLAWLDLEMTGLDPNEDVILQAALVITNRDLTVLEEFVCDVWQPESALAKMTPFVREMHETNGLVERVRKSKLELQSVEKRLLERVAGWCGYPALLCGNTIGQDRKFIDHWMPGLSGYLHYRMLDVTSLKLVAQLWHGEQAVYKKPKDGAHDALFDVRQSIEEFAFYKKTLLKSG